MSKVLVTGGAGFIASHIVDSLVDKGHQVVIIDDLSHGREENINSHAKFYKMDIRDKDLEKVFKEEKPDYVDHHAAQMDIRKSVEDPAFDAEVNIVGTLNILENARKHGVKKVIFASSGGAIYGEGNEDILPFTEEAPPKPISPYGVGKCTGEYYLNYYHEVYGLDFTALRYGNVYGPRQDPEGEAGVIAIFINAMFRDGTIKIFGDGEQLRDYVYVGDVTRANCLAMENGKADILNIGTTRGASVNELFQNLAGIIGFKKEPVYEPSRAGEILRTYLNFDLAKNVLNWQPQVTLEEGLKNTVEFFKSKVQRL